jgi:hypothetical protein
MGIRIKRSIGWGMPWAQFVELCNAPDKNDVSEWLYDTFHNLKDKDLIADSKVYSALINGDAVRYAPSILQKRLLAKKFTMKINESVELGSAVDLFDTVYNGGDDNIAIIFYPSLHYRSKWYRSDDDIDYAFESVRGDNGEPAYSEEGYSARDFVVYKRYGHYPYSNYITTLDGTPVEWDHYALLNKRDDWIAAVPGEIRWYLTQHDILDFTAVNQLRPIVAQWWS